MTSDSGAIRSTNMGKVIPGTGSDVRWQNEYVKTVVKLLHNQEELMRLGKEVQEKAVKRFSLDVILKKWEDEVFNE